MIQLAALPRPTAAGPLALAPVGDGAAFDVSFATLVGAAMPPVVPVTLAMQPTAASGNALPLVLASMAGGTPTDSRSTIPATPVSAVPSLPTPAAAMLAPIAQVLAAVAEPMPGDPAPPPPPPAPPPSILVPPAIVRSRQPAATVPASTRSSDATPSPKPADDTSATTDATPPGNPVLPGMPAPPPLPLPVAMQVSASPDTIAAMIVHAPVTPVGQDTPRPAVASPTRAATQPVAHEAAIEHTAVGQMPPPVEGVGIAPAPSPVMPRPIAASRTATLPIVDTAERGRTVPATPPPTLAPATGPVASARVATDPPPVHIAEAPGPAGTIAPMDRTPHAAVVTDGIPIATMVTPPGVDAKVAAALPHVRAVTDGAAVATPVASPGAGAPVEDASYRAPAVADAGPVDVTVAPDHPARTMRQHPSSEPSVAADTDPADAQPAFDRVVATEHADPSRPAEAPVIEPVVTVPTPVTTVAMPVPEPVRPQSDGVVARSVARMAVPSPEPRTGPTRSDPTPATVPPVAVQPAPEPSIASAAPILSPVPRVAPVADGATREPPVTERTSPTPVAHAEPPVVAAPALTIVAGTTAPAFRLFAQAIHDARRDDAAVDPVAAAPVGAIEPIRVAPPAGDAQGGTLDMRDHRWPHAMVERIERLRDAAGAAADAADTGIRLIPDALGTIDVSVRRDGDTVHVRFTAEQAATRALLTDAQPRLAEFAEAKGIKLGQASVEGGGPGQNQQLGQQPGQRQPQARQPRSDAPARVGVRSEDPTSQITRIA